MADIDFRIGGDNAEFLAALNQSRAAARQSADSISSAFGSMQGTFARVRESLMGIQGIIVGLSTAAFVGQIKGAIHAMDEMNDIADKTGVSVESLSSEINTLAPAGHSAETLTTALVRLQKGMQGADEESKGAGAAFKALGVSAEDASGNLRDPLQVLREIAVALDKYSDGANKTALAVALFGKAGADLLPMLKDMVEQQQRASTVSTEAAQAAETFNKQIGLMKQVATEVSQSIAASILPTLVEMAKQFNEGREAAGGFFSALARYGLTVRGPVDQIAHLRDQMAELRADMAKDQALLGSGKVQGGRADDLQRRIDIAREKLKQLEKDVAFWDGVAKRNGLVDDANEMSGGTRQGAKPAAPRLPSAERSQAADARAKAEADAILSYQREIAQLDRLSAVERTRWETEQGRFRDFSTATKARLIDLAKVEDGQTRENKAAELALKMIREREEAAAKADKEAMDAAEKEAKRLEDLAEKWRNVAEPTRAYVKQLEEIRDLVAKGKLTPEQGINAEFDVQQKMDDALKGKDGKDDKLEYVSTLQSAFSQLFSSIRQGTLTSQSLLVGAFNFAANAVSNALASISAKWLAEQIVGKVSAIKTALSDISASAARAGAAAFASTAAIPVVGPELAPAAGAAAYSGAMGFAALLPAASAAKGYDIPGGINPVTQLHQREMVLPAHIADPLRDSLAGGGLGGGTTVQLNVQAIDGRSVAEFFRANGDHVYDAVQRAVRQGRR